MSHADFWGADLHQSSFVGGTVSHANFSTANLTGAPFYSVTATDTDFAASMLYGSMMEGAHLAGAAFGEAVGIESVRFEPEIPTCDNQTEWPIGFTAPCPPAR